ncbi:MULTISPECIES: ABC transporter ATP-binding protein [Bacillaceae]|uniref:ABC transporter ATP-binding protein n=1 Tax=Evansella alkalicola TaxID=745819 RepID=A0ABS6JPY3_9BACI|nr:MULTISPECIES: ABC transporter ATP-binding protein [Bacillaceae]MBU9720619.1 ABC transporter ATP-binding protein [Bacillus alkalicola]
MIQIKDLEIKYGSFTAVNKISLNIKENSSCAIIGPSGCGKSTLLYGLAGIVKPASGDIFIREQPVKENRRKTGLILQNYGLFPWKTVWENAILGLKIRSISMEEIDNTVTTILQELDILELKDKFPVQLSGGQKQRVAIARALSIQPDLLLMDEPFSALDAITREALQNLVLSLQQQKKMSIVFVTHNIEEAVFLGQQIVIMDKTEGSIKHIIENKNFGDRNFRFDEGFFQLCMEVRRIMEVSD